MSFMKKSAAALVLTGVSVAVSTAFAAGFQLTEQSSLGAGRAYAFSSRRCLDRFEC